MSNKAIGMKDIYVAKVLANTSTSYQTGLPGTTFANAEQTNTKLKLAGEYSGSADKTLYLKFVLSTTKFQYSYDDLTYTDITNGLTVDGITYTLPTSNPSSDQTDDVSLTANTGFYNLARAVNGKESEKFSIEKNYSDDALEDITRAFDSVDLEIETSRILSNRRALLYGKTLAGGMLSGASEDIASDIAIGWRNKLQNGKYRFIWYYVATVTDGEQTDTETIADKPKSQTAKTKLTARAREKADSDGKHRYYVEIMEDELLASNTDAATAIASWFSHVQEPILT